MVFHSAMKKELRDLDNAQVVTNPQERFRTFLRKLAFRWHRLRQRIRHTSNEKTDQ
jgi:hypothetical protein